MRGVYEQYYNIHIGNTGANSGIGMPMDVPPNPIATPVASPVAPPSAEQVAGAQQANNSYIDPLPEFKPGFRMINPVVPEVPAATPAVPTVGTDVGAPAQNQVPVVSNPSVAPAVTPVVPNIPNQGIPGGHQPYMNNTVNNLPPYGAPGEQYSASTGTVYDSVNTASDTPINSGMNDNQAHLNIQNDLNKRLNMSIR